MNLREPHTRALLLPGLAGSVEHGTAAQIIPEEVFLGTAKYAETNDLNLVELSLRDLGGAAAPPYRELVAALPLWEIRG